VRKFLRGKKERTRLKNLRGSEKGRTYGAKKTEGRPKQGKKKGRWKVSDRKKSGLVNGTSTGEEDTYSKAKNKRGLQTI